MWLFRWAIVAMIAGVAGSGASRSEAAPKSENVATTNKKVEHEVEPRVEIGPAVLYIFDESGRVVAVE